ncbi:MAG: hypothetical protein K0S55_1003 [Clostridia bacterium]|nr:hypothetical protein [Clostridia bacterium]
MNNGKKLAPHEALEIHELLTFKNVCATKAATMSSLVNDQVLKTLLQQDLSMAQSQIKELKSLIQNDNNKAYTDYINSNI